MLSRLRLTRHSRRRALQAFSAEMYSLRPIPSTLSASAAYGKVRGGNGKRLLPAQAHGRCGMPHMRVALGAGAPSPREVRLLESRVWERRAQCPTPSHPAQGRRFYPVHGRGWPGKRFPIASVMTLSREVDPN